MKGFPRVNGLFRTWPSEREFQQWGWRICEANTRAVTFGVDCPAERCSCVRVVLEFDRCGNRDSTGRLAAFPCQAREALPVLRTRGAAVIGTGQKNASSIQPPATDLPLSVWPSRSDWAPHKRSVESRVSGRELGGRGFDDPHLEIR